jgi:hypothetical protein
MEIEIDCLDLNKRIPVDTDTSHEKDVALPLFLYVRLLSNIVVCGLIIKAE